MRFMVDAGAYGILQTDAAACGSDCRLLGPRRPRLEDVGFGQEIDGPLRLLDGEVEGLGFVAVVIVCSRSMDRECKV